MLNIRLLNDRRFHLAVIALLGLAVYSNTFDAPFVLDDHTFVEMQELRDLGSFTSLPSLREAALRNPRYVGLLTFALNYRLGGLDAAGYHAVNLAVHVLNASLLYCLVALTLRTPFFRAGGGEGAGRYDTAAFAAALIFVAHPLQTQAVTYIAQRFASLATFFYLLTLVAYAAWRLKAAEAVRHGGPTSTRPLLRPPALFFLVLSLLSAALAMRTKETAFTLPLAAAAYEFLFFAGGVKKRVACLLPLALVAALAMPPTAAGPSGGIPASTGPGEAGVGGGVDEAGVPPGGVRAVSTVPPWTSYLATQPRVVVTYVRLLLLPVNQNLDYDYPVYRSFFAPQVLLSSLFLLMLLGLGAYLVRSSTARGRARRLAAFGIFWFFIALSVESAVPLADVIFEHRAYLPAAGAAMAFASLAAALHERASGERARRAASALAAAVLLSLALLTYARNETWRSEVGLWEDAARKSPLKARPRNNLGLAYFKQGDVDAAIGHYRAALALDPGAMPVHDNLGSAYLAKGMVDEAIEEYVAALTIEPYYVGSLNNLALAYMRKGMVDEAIEFYEYALTLEPRAGRVHYNLGLAYMEKGWNERAREQFALALRFEPRLKGARDALERASE